MNNKGFINIVLIIVLIVVIVAIIAVGGYFIFSKKIHNSYRDQTVPTKDCVGAPPACPFPQGRDCYHGEWGPCIGL